MSVFRSQTIYSLFCMNCLLCFNKDKKVKWDHFQIREEWGRGRTVLKPEEYRNLRMLPNRFKTMCEMLLQGPKHYSLGTETCLREFADTGSSTSMSFSCVVMRPSETADMRVERLRRPGPRVTANQCSMIRRANGGTPPRVYTAWEGSQPPGKESTNLLFLLLNKRKNSKG